ncbi:MAG: GAF domain-containing sensor histidine kinase [Coriobacteriales bacterium]|jgi:signal transduction histidine kinase
MSDGSVGYDGRTWRQRFVAALDFVQKFPFYGNRDEIFARIAEQVRVLLCADQANIRVLSGVNDSFVSYAASGSLDLEQFGQYQVVSLTCGRIPELMRTGEPLVFDFDNPEKEDVWEGGQSFGIKKSVTVLMSNMGQVVGAMDVLFKEKLDFSSDDLAWLKDVGNLTGNLLGRLLIDESQLSLRIEQERRNLSREIHDNLGQCVNIVEFEAQNMQMSLEDGDMDSLRNELDRLCKSGDEAVQLVRSELISLGSDSTEDGVFADDVRDYLDSFSKIWGLPVEFSTSGEADGLVVPGRVRAQLTRILSEAVTNTVRHAEASKAEVKFEVTDSLLSLTISDDGCGFLISKVPKERMGLRVMAERAESIGARLAVASVPGEGTTIQVDVPRWV